MKLQKPLTVFLFGILACYLVPAITILAGGTFSENELRGYLWQMVLLGPLLLVFLNLPAIIAMTWMAHSMGKLPEDKQASYIRGKLVLCFLLFLATAAISWYSFRSTRGSLQTEWAIVAMLSLWSSQIFGALAFVLFLRSCVMAFQSQSQPDEARGQSDGTD